MLMRSFTTLSCAILLAATVGCSGDELPDDVPLGDEPTAEEEAVTTPDTGPIDDSVEPPPFDEPVFEPPTLPEPALPIRESAEIDPAAYRLAPGARVGQHLEWRLRFTEESDVSVESGGRTLSAHPTTGIEATIDVEVLAVDKGRATRTSLTFVAATGSRGGPTGPRPAGLPEPGAVWQCGISTAGQHCSVQGESASFPAPRWLPLGLPLVLPGDAVMPADTWTRRSGIADVLGLADRSAARARFVAEAPYETLTGRRMVVSMAFDGTSTVSVFGGEMAMQLTGVGGFEFDLSAGHIATFDYSWTGVTGGFASAGGDLVGHARRQTTTLRLEIRRR